MKVTSQSKEIWDAEFFARFSSFRNNLYRDEDFFLEEGVEDFSKLFHPDSPFSREVIWQAVLFFDPETSDRCVARALCTLTRAVPDGAVNLGFFECINSVDVAQQVFAWADEFARQHSRKLVKGPIDGHFFNRYRFRISGSGQPFYGEPYHKDYYPQLFEQAGFQVCGRWTTFRARPAITKKAVQSIARAVTQRTNSAHAQLRVRNIEIKNWQNELNTVYQLLMCTFKNMPEYEPLSADAFMHLMQTFRYLINPRFVTIAEIDSQPVGFQISFFDPLPVLLSAQNRSKKAQSKVFRTMTQLQTLLRLKLNIRRLLVPYAGRVETWGQKHLKGVIAAHFSYLKKWLFLYRVREALICYVAENSKSLDYFQRQKDQVVASYVLYQRNAQPGTAHTGGGRC